MSRNLVIVESPAKAKTIERYLGPDFKVLASYGHVRDLPENPGRDGLGVDVEHDFAPQYVVVPERRRQLEAIGRAAREADAVYLATDLDREGEAIAWHVAEAVGLPPEKTRRVTFSEITERAIREAFANPRGINRDLVDAQQARRVVDRIVGYLLSPLLWRKVRRGLSAGRVQSVAVRLVVEREREIRAFVPREYWTIEVRLATPTGETFVAELVRIDEAKPDIPDRSSAEAHAAGLRELEPVVTGRATKRQRRTPPPPFTTSTLQQEASRKLGFSPQRTMRVAQRLYEGVETPEGVVGLITYMRTDSVSLSSQALAEAEAVVRDRFGDVYAVAGGRRYRTRSRTAQEAHEAIRPTSFARDPDALAPHLDRDEARLYRLIWQRALASQMAPRELETTSIELAAGRYGLRATATRTVFDGYSRVYTEGRDDEEAEDAEGRLPDLAEGDRTRVEEVLPSQHFTEPPPRYTEASLVKALEEHGIGRPSTYAATIATIVERGYVEVKERRLYPTLIGEIVTDLLVGHFGEFVDVRFTARMEEDLDRIAAGRRRWVPVVRSFYEPFRALVEAKAKELRRADVATRPTDERCSLGHPMVLRIGRYGPFLACSEYPDHKETRPLPDGTAADGGDGPEAATGDGGNGTETGPDLEGVGEPCPECGATDGGTLVAKRSRFGPFVGCDRYPACRYVRRTSPEPEPLPFEVPCPSCETGRLVARRARRTGNVFWGCSRYPSCRFTTAREPTGAVHDADAGPIGREADGGRCLRCGAPVSLPEGPLVGLRLSGGPPDPGALAGRRHGGRAAGERRSGGSGTRSRGSARSTGRRSGTGSTGEPGGSRRASSGSA
ncbi:MAG TPA: type I DNA topoisomerase, partial [Candidatus Binatia bacterium]|nr:type I DNA topoisomerase [Candidatus Binatia bacterium]